MYFQLLITNVIYLSLIFLSDFLFCFGQLKKKKKKI